MAELDSATRCHECEMPFTLDADGRIPAHETPFGPVREPHPPCAGGGRGPLVRKDYVVRGSLAVTIRIPQAKDADEAAWQVDNSDSVLDIDYDGISIDEVVSADRADDFNAADERSMCARPRCGHLVADHTGLFSPRDKDDDGKETRVRVHPEQCDRYGCKCLRPIQPEAVA